MNFYMLRMLLLVVGVVVLLFELRRLLLVVGLLLGVEQKGLLKLLCWLVDESYVDWWLDSNSKGEPPLVLVSRDLPR